jgi:hypothetical protein
MGKTPIRVDCRGCISGRRRFLAGAIVDAGTAVGGIAMSHICGRPLLSLYTIPHAFSESKFVAMIGALVLATSGPGCCDLVPVVVSGLDRMDAHFDSPETPVARLAQTVVPLTHR